MIEKDFSLLSITYYQIIRLMNYEHFQHQNKNIFLVNMTKELDHYFSELVENGIKKYLKLNKKIWIIVNKKGYSQGIICYDCGFVPQCKKCSVAVSYHKQKNGEMMGLCHICKTQYNFPQKCEKCGSKNIGIFWIGTQQVAERIQQEFWKSSLIIESETVNSPNKIKKLKEQMNTQAPNIIIGTSLLSQPIQNFALDLIIFLNADIGLNIPDYNANENNFLLLYETCIKHTAQQYIIQSFNPDHYSIRSACKLDKDGFYQQENEFRQKHKYPPFADLCVILYKNEIEEKVFKKVDQLYKELLYLAERYQMKELEIYSTPPLIYKMFGKYRYNIIIKGKEVRNFMDIVYTKLNLQAKGFKINRDADSII